MRTTHSLLLKLALCLPLWGCAGSVPPPDEAPLVVVPPAQDPPEPPAETVAETQKPKELSQREMDRKIAANTGILGKLNEGSWGPDETPGFTTDIAGGLGGLIGGKGPLTGTGGLGTRGSGLGGGGIGLGVGHVSGSGYGRGSGSLGRSTRVKLSKVQVLGRLDQPMARRILRTRLYRLRSCYDQEKANAGKLGRLDTAIGFNVDKQGQVDKPSARMARKRRPDMEACIVREVKRIKFPASAHTSRVLYQVRFEPAFTGAGGGGSGSIGMIGQLRGPHVVTPRSRVVLSPPVVSAGYNKTILMRSLQRRLGTLRRCYETALRKNPSLRSDIRLRFSIGSKGRVTVESTTQKPRSNATLSRCVELTFKRIHLPAPKVGTKVPVEVQQVITFRPPPPAPPSPPKKP